jgi:hypothetical protein
MRSPPHGKHDQDANRDQSQLHSDQHNDDWRSVLGPGSANKAEPPPPAWRRQPG